MSRPMLLVFLLLVLIITSQFEWKQQLVIDLDSTPSISQKQHQISKREEVVKEKQCRDNNETTNDNASPLTEHVIGLERQQILGN
ncbi:hypothetical protein CFP56_022395 [Quercus suber]|uniref:Uncharacterized protein n=1 Tax=Quercus suber TaxID=58331 RepID=A0AAW0KAX1_QUESU